MWRNALRKQRLAAAAIARIFILHGKPRPSSPRSIRSQHSDSTDARLESLTEEEILALIRDCCEQGSLDRAKRLQASILHSGAHTPKILSKYLVRMFFACGSVEDAQRIFNELDEPDLVSWTELIKGYAQSGHHRAAFSRFHAMLLAGSRPDRLLLLKLLNQSPLDRQQAKLLEVVGRESGYDREPVVGTSLLAAYDHCGTIEDRDDAFLRIESRDAAAWNAMIWSCIRRGEKRQALLIFRKMEDEGVVPDAVDYLAALAACESLAELEALRGEIFSRRLEENPAVVAELIESYGRFGNVEEAERLLFTYGRDDAPCWTSLLSAYARLGHHRHVLVIFHQMQHRKLTAIFATFAAVLDACAGLGALVEGRVIHRRVVEEELPIAGTLARSLLNMYAQCGELQEAWNVFAQVSGKRSLDLWNSCVDAFAMHGQASSALQLFRLMQQEGVQPNQATFSSLLSLCCYVGLVQAGFSIFTSMVRDNSLVPSVDNYACAVDLLGRAGRLEEAENLIARTPHRSSPVLWSSLLAACRNRGDIERAKRAAVHIFTLDSTIAGVYVVLARIYESTGRPEIARRIRKLMLEREVNSELARSWIEIAGVVHEFTAADQSHPQHQEIHAAIEKLEAEYQLWEATTTDIGLIMHDVDEEDGSSTSVHSERLAVIFGILNSRDRTPLRVFKNRRMCSDCHAVVAMISKLASREITVRDSARFHRFEQGSCSCGGYW